jgi:hypothetical protein
VAWNAVRPEQKAELLPKLRGITQGVEVILGREEMVRMIAG